MGQTTSADGVGQGRERGNRGRRRGPGNRLRPLAVLAFAALLPGAAACSGEGPFAPELEDLARAERQWDESGPASYEYVYAPSCFCPYTPRRVTVRDGEVVSVELIEPDTPLPGPPEIEGYTVEQLLERVREELRRNPYRARLELHPTLGYPVDAWFDYEENAIDEEWGFSVTAFQTLD